jgi:hypothetical protein
MEALRGVTTPEFMSKEVEPYFNQFPVPGVTVFNHEMRLVRSGIAGIEWAVPFGEMRFVHLLI